MPRMKIFPFAYSLSLSLSLVAIFPAPPVSAIGIAERLDNKENEEVTLEGCFVDLHYSKQVTVVAPCPANDSTEQAAQVVRYLRTVGIELDEVASDGRDPAPASASGLTSDSKEFRMSGSRLEIGIWEDEEADDLWFPQYSCVNDLKVVDEDEVGKHAIGGLCAWKVDLDEKLVVPKTTSGMHSTTVTGTTGLKDLFTKLKRSDPLSPVTEGGHTIVFENLVYWGGVPATSLELHDARLQSMLQEAHRSAIDIVTFRMLVDWETDARDKIEAGKGKREDAEDAEQDV